MCEYFIYRGGGIYAIGSLYISPLNFVSSDEFDTPDIKIVYW